MPRRAVKVVRPAQERAAALLGVGLRDTVIAREVGLSTKNVGQVRTEKIQNDAELAAIFSEARRGYVPMALEVAQLAMAAMRQGIIQQMDAADQGEKINLQHVAGAYREIRAGLSEVQGIVTSAPVPVEQKLSKEEQDEALEQLSRDEKFRPVTDAEIGKKESLQ